VHQPGALNAITDVAGVRVGQTTRHEGDSIHTGVTAILPHPDVFVDRVLAGSFVLNGAGEVSGLTQVVEWGLLETPILLTNTMAVGKVSDAAVKWMTKRFPKIGTDEDVVIPLVGECDDSWLNDAVGRHVRSEHVYRAIEQAASGRVAEGSVGAGTGLGQAFLLWSAAQNRYQVVPSEGGHVDLAARTPLEHGLVAFLTGKYGRVSCERVLSGRGLVDAFKFLSEEPACRGLIHPETAAALAAGANDPAAEISRRAIAGTDPLCEMALALFCSVLGAVAGNLGLMVLATGGVYVAGGIAPRILPFLQRGGFREAFDRKGRLHTLVERIPAYVVTHAQPGLLGAALVASDLG